MARFGRRRSSCETRGRSAPKYGMFAKEDSRAGVLDWFVVRSSDDKIRLLFSRYSIDVERYRWSIFLEVCKRYKTSVSSTVAKELNHGKRGKGARARVEVAFAVVFQQRVLES